ncbi:MAG: tRNA 2-thiouridine(34) synthase MnmA [candidate division SR1 bacterium]|nr:tRNA 2-thiouridine(34) synthase MnmA [candidate division SR1 bacterium]
MKKVLIGLSGGVDSAVAAYLLKQQGYNVTAGFMKNYVAPSGNCTTYEDAEEAIKVANFLGIEIISFDLQKEYDEKILHYIYEGYKKGITPNPDVLCNTLIKFDVFLKKALDLGFDYIATGHYARIDESKVESLKSIKSKKNSTTGGLDRPDRLYRLLMGKDLNKDQSYFLSGLNQFQLSKSLFPIGGMSKPEVRAIASQIQLPNAERKDSQGLCFVGNIPIKKFLEQKLPKKIGSTITQDGKIVGQHDGARFYTLGQRQGLNLAPDLFVTHIDVKKNIVTVGPRNDAALNQKIVHLQNRHRISKKYTFPLEITAKIRYRQIPQPATLVQSPKSPSSLKSIKSKVRDMMTGGPDDLMTISFQETQRSIPPGQVAVAYIDDECIGSGTIQ